jgi:O-antigen ligase
LRDLLFWFSGAVLVTSLVFGGATSQGLISEAVPELMSLPLLAVALPRAMPFLKSYPSALALLVGVIALPCLQLIPLPPELWKALPGRDFVAEILTTAQAPISWRPISLIPSETWRALLSLLPAVAIFLAILTLGRDARRRLLLVALAIGVASAVLGMAQVMGGGSRDLYLFAFTNEGTAVGFFANHNHLAALEYALMPLGAAALAETQTPSPAILATILGAVASALLFALILTASRSTMILGGASAAATLAFVLTPELTVLGRRRSLGLIAAFALALLPIAIGFGFLSIFTRFGAHDLGYLRDMIAANTWAGLKSYFPVGTGLGTFPSVYPLHERVADLIPDFVNRAHNDGLETLFEGGAGSLLLLLGFIAWLGASTFRAFVREDAAKGRQARAGVIAMWLLLIHSLWDYPLRTTALETLFCLCAALQFAPPPPRSFPHRRGGQGEHRSRTTRGTSQWRHGSRGTWRLLAVGRSEAKITRKRSQDSSALLTQKTQDSVRAAWK